MTRVQYKNWAVDSSGETVGSSAYEVRVASTGDLATIYTSKTGPTLADNPGEAQIGGNFTFFADPDEYTITIGLPPSDSTVPWDAVSAVDALALTATVEDHAERLSNVEDTYIPPYTSRAAAEASNVPTSVNHIDVKTPTGDKLFYKRDATGTALTTADGAKWSPDGMVTPNHWQENTTPGTTDMTAAINAACAYGPNCNVTLLAQRYNISDRIEIFGHDDAKLLEGYRFRGQGRGLTEIWQSDPTKDHIYAIKNPNAVVPADISGWMIGDVGGFTLRSMNVTKAQKGAAIRHSRNLNTLFRDILITGPTNGVISEGSAQCLYNRMFTRGTDRGSGETLDSVYTFTDNAAKGSTNRSFGNVMSNCEHQAGEDADRIFDLQGVDGLYVTNSHFNNAVKKIHIRPDNSEWQTNIFQVMFNNCYFDGNGSPEDFLYIEATNPGATTPAVRIEGIYFNGCTIRGGSNSVLKLGKTSGEVAGLSSLKTVHFTDCHVKQYFGRIYDLGHQTLANPETIISNIEVIGGTIEDGPWTPRTGALSAFLLQGRNIKVHGVTVQGGWDDTGEYVARVAPTGVNVSVANNVFDVSRTLPATAITAGAVNCVEVGNIVPSAPGVYGMNATLQISATDRPGLVLDPRTVSTTSDIVTRKNSVLGIETSLTVAMENGGYMRWMKDATDAETGTDGGTEIGRIDETRFNTTVPQRVDPVLVANLPAAGTSGAGARHFVSDADDTTFQSIVAAGGANAVPVYSDGTNWRIG